MGVIVLDASLVKVGERVGIRVGVDWEGEEIVCPVAWGEAGIWVVTVMADVGGIGLLEQATSERNSKPIRGNCFLASMFTFLPNFIGVKTIPTLLSARI